MTPSDFDRSLHAAHAAYIKAVGRHPTHLVMSVADKHRLQEVAQGWDLMELTEKQKAVPPVERMFGAVVVIDEKAPWPFFYGMRA